MFALWVFREKTETNADGQERNDDRMKRLPEAKCNCLEAIYRLQKEQRGARVCTIRDYLGIAGPTVSVTLDGLEDAGLIVRREYGMVDLTPEGRRIAKKLYEKNVFLGRLLMAMGIEKEIARRDAMAVKNVLSDESFERLRGVCTGEEVCLEDRKSRVFKRTKPGSSQRKTDTWCLTLERGEGKMKFVFVAVSVPALRQVREFERRYRERWPEGNLRWSVFMWLAGKHGIFWSRGSCRRRYGRRMWR